MLADLPILRYLPDGVRDRVIESFEPVSFTFGMPIVREGEPADALYLLVSGRARVVKNAARDGTTNGELSLGVLKAGDTFGEIGLLEQTTRTLTVRASGDVEALRLDREVFDVLLRERPELRQYFELQVSHRRLSNFFKEFTAFAKLPAPALAELLAELDRKTVQTGELVIREGDPSGPMYIVEEGRLRVFVEEDGRRKYIAYYRKGDFFGELSIFKGAPRAASVEAVSECTLSALRQDTFNRLLHTYPEFRARIEERIAQYDYKNVARVPLDFAEESLPAELRASVQVSADQLDAPARPRATPSKDEATPAEAAARAVRVGGRAFQEEGEAHPPLPARLPDRRDGLRRRLPGDGLPALRARRQPGAHRQLVHTSLDGTSLRALCQAASELGLAARSVKASPRNFERMPLPAIIHWEGNHWVVLYDVSDTHAWLVDPALGHVKVTRDELLAKWTGYAALFDYTEAFEQAPVAKASLAWLWPFLRPHVPAHAQGAGARRHRQRAADGAAGLHADHRRSRRGGPGPFAA